MIALLLTLALAGALPALDGPRTRSSGATAVNGPHQASESGETATAEERLAARYAPIAYLKTQAQPCDTAGESFAPAPVEIVLGDPAVALKRPAGVGLGEATVVTDGPSAADLAAQDQSAYLDLPGEPLTPGCDYEREFRARMVGREPVAYARFATEPGWEGLALQYWLWYPFNDFNNRHEGDWEMIQLVFAAGTAAEALDLNPTLVAYAQHGGGETVRWGAPKLQIEDGHPVIRPAAGSHATYFNSRIYLGWGEGGTGFGCDDARGPATRVPLHAVLLPERVDPHGPFAWLLFPGRWGQRQPWEYNGPTGPPSKQQWDRPLSWVANLGTGSLALPDAPTLGPSPTGAFCAVTAAGSQVLMFGIVHPAVVAVELIVLLVVLLLLWRSVRGLLGPTLALYRQYWRVFMPLGLLLVPLGLASYLIGLLVTATPPVAGMLDWLDHDPGLRLAIALVAGGPQGLAALILVIPAITRAVVVSEEGETLSLGRAFRPAPGELRYMVAALLRATVVIAPLALSVIGLPWALRQSVRWGFWGQAVVAGGARSGKQALALSATTVDGRWWQAIGVGTAFSLIAAAPGPLVGILLLVFAGRSVELVNALGGILYALTVPFGAIGLALFYRRRRRPAPNVAVGASRPRGRDALDAPQVS